MDSWTLKGELEGQRTGGREGDVGGRGRREGKREVSKGVLSQGDTVRGGTHKIRVKGCVGEERRFSLSREVLTHLQPPSFPLRSMEVKH